MNKEVKRYLIVVFIIGTLAALEEHNVISKREAFLVIGSAIAGMLYQKFLQD